MKVAFVTEEEHQVALDRLAKLEQLVASLAKGGPARAFLTPKEAAKRHRVAWRKVYEALDSGRLRASRNDRGEWRILPADADRWYARFQAGRSNQ